MISFAARLAAALATVAAVSTPVLAAPVAEFALEQTVAVQQAELAVYCEYVIVWDAWGNAYYEYYCY